MSEEQKEERQSRRPKFRRGRKKVCQFCADKNAVIDYKDAAKLRKYLTERGKILPRRMSGTCAKHQREIAIAIKLFLEGKGEQVVGIDIGGKKVSTSSNDQGRAYEYAWITALSEILTPIRKTRIVCNSSLEANGRAWNAVSQDKRELFAISANAAVETILELEPCMEEDDGDTLLLEFQKDEAGEAGDVRDIVIKRERIEWEVGLSIKHNHTAVKHSRLSHVLDFGNEWYGIPCSKQYWNDVNPIFDMLDQEKNRGTNWSDLADKDGDVYIPLLQAFLDEVNRVYRNDSNVAIRMFEYLVGVKDYHKIVSNDSKRITLIHTFNLHGTLNQPSRMKVSAVDVPVAETPTEIIATRFKPRSRTTVEIYMDNGWAFSFRIHSASTRVQPSLKFDVQFISTPASVLHVECKWNRR